MKYIGLYFKIYKNWSIFIFNPINMIMEKNMRIGKFFSNCAKNKKIHGSGYRNCYATGFTPRNCYATGFTPRNHNRTTATTFWNLDCSDLKRTCLVRCLQGMKFWTPFPNRQIMSHNNSWTIKKHMIIIISIGKPYQKEIWS